MANTLTTAGATHISERDAASPLTNAFDALLLSRGNDATATSDNRSAVSSSDEIAGSLTQVASGYPVLGDTDTRNTGAGTTTWSWRFDVPAGLAAFVASNLQVTNYDAGAPSATEALLVHCLLATPIQKRTTERAVIFVNVAAGATAGTGPTVVVVNDEPGLVPRLHTYTQRARALATYGPQGIAGAVAQAAPGEAVRVMAMVLTSTGGQLTPSQTQTVYLDVEAHQANGTWAAYSSENVGTGSVLTATEYQDVRWPYVGGYNWFHEFEVPESNDETAYRLTYTVRERGGPSQRITVEVRTGAEVSGVTP